MIIDPYTPPPRDFSDPNVDPLLDAKKNATEAFLRGIRRGVFAALAIGIAAWGSFALARRVL